MPSFLTWQLIVSVVVILTVVHVILVGAGLCTYLERKVSAYIQDRVGPNRTGFDLGIPQLSFLKGMLGLGQALADGLKFILKEDFMPKGADKWLFTLAPMVVVIPALMGFAVIPWGGVVDIPSLTFPAWAGGWTIEAQRVTVAAANINIGIIYMLATASLGIYGIVLGGWASNNKYSFLGGLRSSAQMISYEIPMGMSLLAVILLCGTFMPQKIVAFQAEHGWFIFSAPIAGLLFFIAALAEANRTPFDNAECEQELVGGYHTEYSAMRFALFFLAEYSHVITSSAFFVLLFLGGYHLPLGFDGHPLDPTNATLLGVLCKCAVYGVKVFLMIMLVMLVRWTIPRLRFDQVMQVAWQGAIPLALVVLVFHAVMVYMELATLVPLLIGNAAIALLTLAVLPLIPRSTANKKIRLAGSRFSPLAGERVQTAPTEPAALEDRPYQGSVAV